jgi:hypothetical protein
MNLKIYYTLPTTIKFSYDKIILYDEFILEQQIKSGVIYFNQIYFNYK